MKDTRQHQRTSTLMSTGLLPFDQEIDCGLESLSTYFQEQEVHFVLEDKEAKIVQSIEFAKVAPWLQLLKSFSLFLAISLGNWL